VILQLLNEFSLINIKGDNVFVSLNEWKEKLLRDRDFKEILFLEIKNKFISINNIDKETTIKSIEKVEEKVYFFDEKPSQIKQISSVVFIIVLLVFLMNSSNENISDNIKSFIFYLSIALSSLLSYFLFFPKEENYVVEKLHVLEVIAEDRKIIIKSNEDDILIKIRNNLTESPVKHMKYPSDNEVLLLVVKETFFKEETNDVVTK
jgi:hypothetical protein